MMRPPALVLLLLLALPLGAACSTRPGEQAGTSPTPAPAPQSPSVLAPAVPPPSSPPPPGQPPAQPELVGEVSQVATWRATRSAELWEFRTDKFVYTFRGCLESLQDGRAAVAPITLPAWKGEDPLEVVVDPPWELAMVDRQPYGPGDPRSDHQIIVIRPLRDVKPGEKLPVRIRMVLRDLPYLHRQQGRHRLLSLTLTPTPTSDHQNLMFALPDTDKPIVPSDMVPTEVLTPKGWRVYRYDVTGMTYSVIHLGFDLEEPTTPLPSIEDLLPADAQADCS